MTITAEQLAALEAAARALPAEKWLWEKSLVYALIDDGYRRGQPMKVNRWTAHFQAGTNASQLDAERLAEFAHAANPATILALIEALRAAEDELARLKLGVGISMATAGKQLADVEADRDQWKVRAEEREEDYARKVRQATEEYLLGLRDRPQLARAALSTASTHQPQPQPQAQEDRSEG